MVCLSCYTPTVGRLCSDCLVTFRPAADRVLPGGVRVVAPFEHNGAAKRLMHLLKYRGVTDFAGLAADLLVDRLPNAPLVPVPRAISRLVKYGVDPALVIAREVSARTGQPVQRLLAARLHTRRRAGGDHASPLLPFRLRHRPVAPIIVVDDVVTTGSTVLAAIAALGPENVVCVAAANSVSRVSSLSRLNSKGR